LNVSNNEITSEGSEFVRDIMKSTQNLKRLDLSHNEFGNAGIKIISFAFGDIEEKVITKIGHVKNRLMSPTRPKMDVIGAYS